MLEGWRRGREAWCVWDRRVAERRAVLSKDG